MRIWLIHHKQAIIGRMIVDIHCHLAMSARRVMAGLDRFSFEIDGATGRPGFDAYIPERLVKSLPWRFLASRLGLNVRGGPGDALDGDMERVWKEHLLDCPNIDRVVLLAFDEYHTDEGIALGPVDSRGARGSSLYVSNSLAASWCAAHPQKLIFGASVHPYRVDAIAALEEVHRHGAVLIKWLPITQNIDPTDRRTAAFVRRAGELGLPLLIHYGGEAVLVPQHVEQENPQPMLDLLARLHSEGVMPPTIIAHVASPSFPWQRGTYVRAILRAVRGQLSGAPLYADISALCFRPRWVRQLLDNEEFAVLRDRLVFGSDFPVMPTTFLLRRRVHRHRAEIRAASSWIERSFQIMRAAGFDEAVFHRTADVLGMRS